MKKWIIATVAVILVATLVVSLVLQSNNNQELKKSLQQAEQKKTQLSNEMKKLESSDVAFSPSELAFMKDTMTTYLSYTNENYSKRFKALEGKIDSGVLNELQGGAATEVPKMKIENKVNGMTIYLNTTEPKSYLMQIETTYTINHESMGKATQLYQVQIEKKEDHYVLDKMQVLGVVQ
ncbi:hypothetical protein [Listeria booriae]|uniref:hypothetical protein n=1 Tax=Listeria booriae TaxID=1552123 RepID=UPI0016242349|nr:hypothetical protein [Listeria booriae]MBC1248111.1 hypothetical protein [Listeria booriae]